VAQLVALRQGISAENAASPEFEAIRQTVQRIAVLDKKYLAYMEYIREGVQDAYKLVKQGQRIHSGYRAGSSEPVSRILDTKQ